jgi:hypothetical protein
MNGNNPLSFDQVKLALQKSLRINDEDQLRVEELFYEADVDGDKVLTKRELKNVILKSLNEGLFEEFFTSHDKAFMELAEVLFEQYFKELYSQGNDNIDKEAFILYLQEKLPSNEKLAKTFIE